LGGFQRSDHRNTKIGRVNPRVFTLPTIPLISWVRLSCDHCCIHSKVIKMQRSNQDRASQNNTLEVHLSYSRVYLCLDSSTPKLTAENRLDFEREQLRFGPLVRLTVSSAPDQACPGTRFC
ncbi:unnamed protein product, partial [Sphacelaria rigidula]